MTTILLVDDHDDIRDMMIKDLHGFRPKPIDLEVLFEQIGELLVKVDIDSGAMRS